MPCCVSAGPCAAASLRPPLQLPAAVQPATDCCAEQWLQERSPGTTAAGRHGAGHGWCTWLMTVKPTWAESGRLLGKSCMPQT